jgi:hypothetical protein
MSRACPLEMHGLRPLSFTIAANLDQASKIPDATGYPDGMPRARPVELHARHYSRSRSKIQMGFALKVRIELG